MADSGTYLYGVVEATAPAEVETTGVADAPVRPVAAAGLVALVSTVELSEFGEEPLRRHLEDFTWLERTARSHHEVVASAGAVTPLVPVRLATVYRNDARVETLLAEHHDAFARALDQVRDRTEWGVKAFWDPATASESEAPADEPGGSGSSGTAYLLRRRNQQRGREQLRHQAATLADELHRRLTEHSVMSRRHRLQDPRLAESDGTMILNGAYLTDNASSAVLAKAVEQLQDAHPEVTLELTGPWVPYSFAEIDAEVEPDR